MNRWLPCWWKILLWAIALAVAFYFDAQIAAAMHRMDAPAPGWFRHSWYGRLLRWPGEFDFTVLLALLIYAARQWDWRGALRLLLCSAMAGANWFVKWLAGRTRPWRTPFVPAFEWHPFKNGLTGLFTQVNLSFPSGHTSLAFATAGCLARYYPRARWLIYAVAAAVAVARVLENAHYLSDVVGGAAMGLAMSHLGWLWFDRLEADRPQMANLKNDPNA